MAHGEMWTYPEPRFSGRRPIDGYAVEAADGDIGKVDEATYEVGRSYIVVDTGPWILGKRVLLPAGVVEQVDHDGQRIRVGRTKDEIKQAPEFDEAAYQGDPYRQGVGVYYGALVERRQGAGTTGASVRPGL